MRSNEQRLSPPLFFSFPILGRAVPARHVATSRSDAHADVPVDGLTIRAVLYSDSTGTVDVTERVVALLTSEGRFRMTPEALGMVVQPTSKEPSAGVFYSLRGKRYFAPVICGKEISWSALLANALAADRQEPTFTLSKWTRDMSAHVELRASYTRLSMPNGGRPESRSGEGRNQAWFMKKDGTVLKQRSAFYFAAGTGPMEPGSMVWQDEFEFDPVAPEDVCALTLFNGEKFSVFGIKREDWKRGRE